VTRLADGLERRRAPGRRLTDRQTAILDLVASGLGNKEIGHQLGISEQAVKEHVSTLLRVLSAPNRAALGDAAATRRFVGTSVIDPEWLRFLFQDSPINVAILAGRVHRFVAVNDAFRQIMGGRDLTGLTFAEAFPDRQDSLALLDQAFRSGERIIRADSARRLFRRPGVEEDGYITTIVQPLPGQDGAPAGLAVFSVDVTDSVRARERVRQLENEQLAILDQLPLGVAVTDRSGNIVRMNDAGRRILPFGGGRVRPRDLMTLHDPATGVVVPESARPLGRALRGERAPETEYVGILVATGERISVRSSAVPLFDDAGVVRGAVAVFARIPS
jgi:PAS domain-containing protein